jgi:hypothetical protein
MDPRECILFSGGTRGSEAEFGVQAERLDIEEVNFSFPDHPTVRTRGRRELTEAELQKGDMSLSYISGLMNRTYSETPAIRKILQTIWYQISNGLEIYVIGRIEPDDTVKGGTGWGAELAKLSYKPLFVFDQQRDAWFAWQRDHWKEADAPRIQQTRFTGTGTRFLEENGKKAIAGLFQRSFDPS